MSSHELTPFTLTGRPVGGRLTTYELAPGIPAAWHGWVRLRVIAASEVAPVAKLEIVGGASAMSATLLCENGRSIFRLHAQEAKLSLLFAGPVKGEVSATLEPIGAGQAAFELARQGGADPARLLDLARRGLGALKRREGLSGVKNAVRLAFEAQASESAYRRWVQFRDGGTIWPKPPESGPRITVLVPATARELETLKRQTYRHWKPQRVDSGTVSEIEGDLVFFLDSKDKLSPHALAAFAQAASENPQAKIFYSDEDILADEERTRPNFKPDWDREYFRSRNLLSRGVALRASLFKEIGGIRCEGERLWDYELGLRAVERCADGEILHIPHVLYHRADAEQIAPSPREAKALPPKIEFTGELPCVSAVICTRDRVELLRDVVEGLKRTRYPAGIEILIVDNGTRDPGTLAYLKQQKVLRDDSPFNFAALNNRGARETSGKLLAFLNNDLRFEDPDWLTAMAQHAMRKSVGAVGAKLLFPDGTIQHAGVALGIGYGAGHPMRGAPNRDPWGWLTTTREVSAVTAACMVVRREVFEELGGFDEENFAVAFNDVDFCLRARAARYSVVWSAKAEVVHVESASRGADADGAKLARLHGESTRLWKRWGKSLARDPYYNPNLSLDSEAWLPSFPVRT